ncbi:hypothetical protein PTKIN_Ptkin02bG0096400 [Pterospermum kingtungense]
MATEARVGIVFRNHLGHVLLSAATRISEVNSPLQAELLAIGFGLEKAQKAHYQHLMVESDSLQAIREIEKGDKSSCEWSHLIIDSSVEFEACHFNYINRLGNQLADSISKSSFLMVWETSILQDVRNVDWFA